MSSVNHWVSNVVSGRFYDFFSLDCHISSKTRALGLICKSRTRILRSLLSRWRESTYRTLWCHVILAAKAVLHCLLLLCNRAPTWPPWRHVKTSNFIKYYTKRKLSSRFFVFCCFVVFVWSPWKHEKCFGFPKSWSQVSSRDLVIFISPICFAQHCRKRVA